MKKLIVLLGIMSLVFTVPVFADDDDDCDDGCGRGVNTTSKIINTNTAKGGNSISKAYGGSSTSKSFSKGGKSVIKDSGNSKSKSTVKNSGNSTNRIKNTVNNNTKVKNNVDVSSKNINKQNQHQRQSQDQKSVARQNQSANNEGINIDASDTYVSNYEHKEAANVASVHTEVGQNGFSASSFFGGLGMNYDAKHTKLIAAAGLVNQMHKSGLLSTEDARQATKSLTNRLLKKVCGKSCALDEEEKVKETSLDKEITGNGGNF